ncbi:MAG: multidrug effflux MFS transporter [Parvibaculum sp.]|jgi:DHA1 family bicyclomycin/chloramphenicol resistance-like MFS transporter|uniref:multidrug effflux MFS transporter n=1 Tax=Parvibaculum sp. TaxID=2024848 RepID=UPI0032ED2BD9
MTVSSPAAEAVGAPRHGLAFTEFVAIVAALMALNALAIDVMLPALGDIGKAFALADPNDRQKVVIVYLLGFGAAQLVYGPMSDRFGRRPILLGGLTLYALAGLLSLVADTMDHLLLARLLQGIGCAAPRVVALSVVRDCYSGARMGKVMSLVMMVFMTVPVIAPSIGQLILFVAPWRAIFLMLTVGGFAMLIWCALRLGETLPKAERRRFSLSAVASAYMATLRTRTTLGYMLATTLIFGALFAFIASAQQVYVDVFDLGASFPVVFALAGSALAAASFLSASLVERIGLRPLSHWALVAYCAISCIQVVVALTAGSSLVPFTVLLLLAVFSFGLVGPSFNAIAMEPLGHIAGTASAMLGFVTTSGGAALGFFVSSHFDGTVLPLTLGFAGFSLLALGVVAWTERGRVFRL